MKCRGGVWVAQPEWVARLSGAAALFQWVQCERHHWQVTIGPWRIGDPA